METFKEFWDVTSYLFAAPNVYSHSASRPDQ
jgi:hypothetical protein